MFTSISYRKYDFNACSRDENNKASLLLSRFIFIEYQIFSVKNTCIPYPRGRQTQRPRRPAPRPTLRWRSPRPWTRARALLDGIPRFPPCEAARAAWPQGCSGSCTGP